MLLSILFTVHMKKCCSETPRPIERLLFRICVAPFLSVISWLVTRLLFRICVQNLCSSFSVSYQLISDKWTHKWNSFFVSHSIALIVTKSLRKSHTIFFTCRFQYIACRLPKFPRTHSSDALLCVLWHKNNASKF